MRNLKHKCLGILAGLGCVALTGAAMAQDAAAGAGAGASTSTGASTNVGMTLPGAAPAAGAAEGASDHDQVVGRLAVGYLGRRSMLVGAVADPTAGTGLDPVEVSAPVIGIRYWLDEGLGIDAGIGLLIAGGSGEVDAGTTTNFDLPGNTVFILHGGVPLALASADHFSFQIVPELNIGIGSGTDADGDVKHSGFLLDIGARAGAEIQFGFIGIPQLALQGSVGVSFQLQSLKTDNDVMNANTTIKTTTTRFATSVNDNPWNIFTSNVAALYYF